VSPTREPADMPPASPRAPQELLPTAERLAGLLDLMAPEELRDLYLFFAERAREAARLLSRNPDQLGDRELEMCVHDIKGTAANLGLDRVAEAAAVVLETARTQGALAAARTAPELIALLERLPAVLAGEELRALLAASVCS
jgi:HPt (histidine-containing phosphotransfer) domain-containing protein